MAKPKTLTELLTELKNVPNELERRCKIDDMLEADLDAQMLLVPRDNVRTVAEILLEHEDKVEKLLDELPRKTGRDLGFIHTPGNLELAAFVLGEGFSLELCSHGDRCQSCSVVMLEGDEIGYWIEDGGVVCKSCAPDGPPADALVRED